MGGAGALTAAGGVVSETYCINLVSLLGSLCSQNYLEKCETYNEQDKNQKEGHKINNNTKKHLHEVYEFFFEHNILKNFEC